MTGKWAYSGNGENYSGNFDTKEEAIAEGRASCHSDFDVAQGRDHQPMISAVSVLEQLGEDACEDCGEAAEGWLSDVSKEQIANLETRLNNALCDWMNDNSLNPNFYSIENDSIENIKHTAPA